MNFNPQEQSSLVGLLAALQGGLPGSTGYGLLQDVLGQQQSRIAARQERTGSLIDMLVNGAAGGQSYEAAQALAGAYTNGSNMPPRIEDALSSLYPGAAPAPAGATFGGANPLPAMSGQPGMQSPVFQPQPMSPQDQLAYQELQQNDAQAQAQAAAAPMMANALANQALSMIQSGTMVVNGQEVPADPSTVIAHLISSESFSSLDATTQAMTLQTINDALANPQAAQAAEPQGPQPNPRYSNMGMALQQQYGG